MRDPYEAYHRHERRRHRAEIAMVIGGFFLALVLMSVVVAVWHAEFGQPTSSVNKENVALNN